MLDQNELEAILNSMTDNNLYVPASINWPAETTIFIEGTRLDEAGRVPVWVLCAPVKYFSAVTDALPLEIGGTIAGSRLVDDVLEFDVGGDLFRFHLEPDASVRAFAIRILPRKDDEVWDYEDFASLISLG